MKVFVTGGTGCLGIHLLKRLVEHNHEVYALIRKTSDISSIENREQIHFVVGDVLDLASFLGKIEKCELVIHCAAKTDFSKTTRKKIVDNFRDNVTGTKNMVEFAIDKQVKHFIYISSCSAMGDYYNGERDETNTCNPDSEYGKSKYEAEKILEDYKAKHNLPITVLRPGLIYGPCDRGGMKKIIEHIDERKFVIFGDGMNQKSLVSVYNLVEAILCVINNQKAKGELFIVADGKNYALNEICTEIATLLGRSPNFLHIPNIISSVIGVLCDLFNIIPWVNIPIPRKGIKKIMCNNTYNINKIVKKLNYRPKVFLHEGLAKEIAWYKGDL